MTKVNVATRTRITANYRNCRRNTTMKGKIPRETFPIFSKVDVNGDKAHPLFQFLKKQLDGFVTNDIKWNFTKFLVVNHEPVKRYGTTTSPLEIENDIAQALRVSQYVDEFDDGGAADGDDDTHDEL
ncbi:unnamed protein product [Peronospora effusa]|nr:unnamed protein product [Peronospora effusa]